MTSPRKAIGVDLGGTNVRAALVREDGSIARFIREKTPVKEGPEATAQLIAKMSKELAAAGGVVGIGIGSPGPLSRKDRRIIQTPNLPGFDNFYLGSRVEEISEIPTLLDNDAKCAAFGEGYFGEAKGLSNFILLTFGTGIGGGVVVDGRMIYGKTDGACEIGHMTLYPNGVPCHCGNKGCFERYCSASAIHRRATEVFQRPMGTKEVMDLHLAGDELATQLLREIAVDMSIAVASLVNIFDPQAIVLGGGVFTTGGGPLVPWVIDEIRDRCFKSSQTGLKIVASKLGGDAGVLGAASTVFAEKL